MLQASVNKLRVLQKQKESEMESRQATYQNEYEVLPEISPMNPITIIAAAAILYGKVLLYSPSTTKQPVSNGIPMINRSDAITDIEAELLMRKKQQLYLLLGVFCDRAGV